MKARALVSGLGALVPLLLAACQPAHAPVPAAPQSSAAPQPHAAASPSAAPRPAPRFRCTLLLGVGVTSEWFEAGFERLVDDARWEALIKPHTSLSEWGDANDSVWSLAPSSPCAEQPAAPDRVLFTAMKWEYKSADEWVAGLRSAVNAIEQHFPSARRIELLTMIRAPHNVSCGNAMSVVEPFVDEAVSRVAAEQPALLTVGPKVESPTCDLFKNGGPHFTDAGRGEIARVLAGYYGRQ